jgi:hypothetical protein
MNTFSESAEGHEMSTTGNRAASRGMRALLRKMRQNPDGLQLAALQRNGGEIRILWQEYEGEPVLHLRFWALSDAGRRVATRSGVALRISEVPAVAKALVVAAELAADYIREHRRFRPQKTEL